MATTREYLRGKVSSVCAMIPDEWNKYHIRLHPDAESLDKIRDWQARGLKNVLKKDEDGAYCIFFSRPASATIKGKVRGFAPPEIWDKDGKTPLQDRVGNGSDAVLKLEVYEFNPPGSKSKAIAARWEAMRVDSLVPYELKRDMTPEQEVQMRGLMEQPESIF